MKLFGINLSYLYIIVPLGLAAFTHIWNPTGFPTFHNDEGGYIERTMQVLNSEGVQESSFYDHPYFGLLFLSSLFSTLDFPDSMKIPSELLSENTVEMLYFPPRVFMGMLAVVDTFLVYKIAQRRYDNTIGLIASTIFAVMPITWIFRRIFLDSIMLPFLLLSIIFALFYADKTQRNTNLIYEKCNQKEKYLLIWLSGIFLGLAIFTKIPAFPFIPLVGFLLYRNSEPRMVALWMIPVILIPSIWPASALSAGEFDEWLAGISLQIHRISHPLSDSILSFFKSDPVLLIAGIASLGYAALKKDYFLILWVIPFLLFLYYVGYVSLFHIIPLLPVFSISIAVAVRALFIYPNIVVRLSSTIIVLGVAIFALICTTMLVTTTLNDAYFKAAAFIAANIPMHTNANNGKDIDKITVIADPFYLWIPQYVFDKGQIYKGYENKTPLNTEKVFLVHDWGLAAALERGGTHSQQLQKIYDKTNYSIASYDSIPTIDFSKYPYSIIAGPTLENDIEIRTNFK